MRSWFAVENSVVDRNDLTAYEKLCCMVLARYAGRQEFDHLLTTDIIAVKMGVDSASATEALRGLIDKGLIATTELESQESLYDTYVHDDQHVIKAGELEKPVETMEMPDLDESPKVTESEMMESPEILERPSVIKAQKAHIEAPAPMIEEDDDLEFESSFFNSLFSDEEKKETISVAEEDDDIVIEDTPMMTQSIHEQSESVRAWIEESDVKSHLLPHEEGTHERKNLKENYVDEVLSIIEEPINDRQARIILGLAEYDLDKIRKCYAAARHTQVSDKIDMLIHELQKKDEPPLPKIIPGKHAGQVDHLRVAQMKQYQKMSKYKSKK